MNYTEEQLNEAYEKMPVHLQGILGDENLGFVIQAIGRENGITPEQSLDIEYLVVHTILGLRKFDNLARNIRDDFTIKGETAWKIAREIQKDIFPENTDVDENINSQQKEIPKINTEITPKKTSIPYNPDINKSEENKEAPQTSQVNNTTAISETTEIPKAPVPPRPIPPEASNDIIDIPTSDKPKTSHPFEEKLRAAQKDLSGTVEYKGIPDPYKERTS